MNTTDAPPAPLPSNVPPDRVRRFRIAGGGLGSRPHETLAQLHDGGPEIVYFPDSPNILLRGGVWVPVKLDLQRRILTDHATFTSVGTVGFGRSLGETWSLIPIEYDPPIHTKYRAILAPFFSQRRMASLEDQVRSRARALVARCAALDRFDFIEVFARVFPSGVFVDMMGLPPEMTPQFLEWEHIIFATTDSRLRLAALRDVIEYLKTVIEDRRRLPSDDLMSVVVAAKVDDQPLSPDELISLCLMLYTAGLDTVASSLSWQFRYLGEHQEPQQYLRENPRLIPGAVEELLRAYGVVNATRIATKDVEIDGITICRGDRITCSSLIAGRDPTAFERASDIDFERTTNRHLAFSTGPHACIGAPLARRELQIALQEWLSVGRCFEVDPAFEAPTHGGGSMGIDSLPMWWR